MLDLGILELLSRLKDEKIELKACGDKIKVLSLENQVSRELKDEITKHKTQLLDFLQSELDKLPVLEHQVEDEKERFPLTDVQQAYWVGRSNDFDMGNVATHIYYEFEEKDLNPELMEASWQKLIKRHEMLRAVIDMDGMQKVLEEVPEYKIKQMDLQSQSHEEIETQINKLRETLSHQILPSDQWPLFDLRISLLPEGIARLHVSIDLLIADAFSCQILLKELASLYKNPAVQLEELGLTFKDYIEYNQAMKETQVYQTSLEYWKNRLDTFPSSPELPLKTNPDNVKQPRFIRKSRAVGNEEWTRIKKSAQRFNVTPSIVLLTAYANVLKCWSKNSHFAINVTLFNRPPLHPDINGIVGDFTSLNLLEINLGKNETFLEQVKGIQNQLFKDLDHKQVSGVQVMRELAKNQGNSKGIVMPIIFTNELLNADEDMFKVNYDGNSEQPLDIEVVGIGKQVYGISQTPQVWIDFQIGERAGVLTYNWDIAKDLFDEGMIDTMFTTFHKLLIKLASQESKWIEANGTLVEYETGQPYSNNLIDETEYKKGIQTIFYESKEKFSKNIAVATKDRRFTYRELDLLSNKVANWLKTKRVKKDELVSIVMKKGWEQVVAVLGVMKSGAAYLPISVDIPKERLDYFMENGNTKIILTQSDMKAKIWKSGYECLCIDTIENFEMEASALEIVNDPSDLAYVIYTSGSTGLPKGVMISYEGMLNTIMDINKRYQITSEDKLLAVSSLNFDLSVFDIFGMLLVGGTVVIPDSDSQRNPKSWLDLMGQEGITIWNSVPALFELLVEYVEGTKEEVPTSLRLVLMSGDWIPVSLVDRIGKISNDLELISLGGATEASIWSIYHPIQESDLKLDSIPYGCPLSNQRVYVMDDAFCKKPIGVPGKIIIGGIGLAKGYWQDKEKTDKSFVINPLTQERVYITGDWGYYAKDGEIIFLGRQDNQIKLGGYRIELGEIESAIMRYPNIQIAVVLVKSEQGKNKSLHGYYETRKDAKVDTKDLMKYLDSQLPNYMIPASLVEVDRIPLTSNGKIDRNALNGIETISEPVQYVQPKTSIEKELVEMLSIELGVENIGIQDNFFELGGDSIAAIRLLLRIKNKYEVELSAKKIFENPIVSDLAKEISRLTCVEEELVDEQLPQIIHDEGHAYEAYPLTGLQQAYLVGRSDAVEFGNVSCHTYEEIEVVDFKMDIFNKAWQILINRHDVLRTVINSDGTQSTLKGLPDYKIDYTDISTSHQQEKEKYLGEIRQIMSHQVMDISHWPLFELKATKLDQHTTRLHISIDAMIADAWSVGILSEELCNLYENIDATLEPLEITYRDYVVGEIALKESSIYEKSLEYWRDKLKNLDPAPDLPIVNNTNSTKQHKFKRRRKELNPNMWKQLKNNAAKFGLTPSGIMMATFAEVLTMWSYSSKFTLNVPQFNRLPMHKQVDKLVGEFASFYLMSIDNSSKDTFLDRARKIQGDLWQNMNHSIVSGVQMLREYSNMFGAGPAISMPIVFTSTIGLLDQDTSPFDGFGDVVFSISQTPQVWLDCQVGEKGNTVIFNWDAVEEIFPEGLLDSMFEAYCSLLDGLAYDEESWNKENLSLLPKHQIELFDETNQTDVPREAQLLQVSFGNMAEKYPENMAVITSDKVFTYHDLLQYADQVGQWLIDEGVKPNQLVAIIMEKGWEQIAAVMGILNAGAAFVPIDIDMPKDRIQYILDNSQVGIIFSQSRLEEQLSYNRKVKFIDQFELDSTKEPIIRTLQKVNDLAYVIYTSGSTGQPKGVKISHENVDNMVFHTNTKLNITVEDRALAITALHHDLSIYDVFGMLTAGGALVIPDHSLKHDPQHLYECMENEQVTVWNSVPAIMDMFVEQLRQNGRRFNSAFRQVILGGDWIPTDLPNRIQSISNNVQILGIGGPTETTVWNIWYPIETVNPDWNSIPYGKPISNSKYYVLDEKLSPRPVWVTGEMYCAGTQLSSGYWNEEEKTKRSYIIYPKTGERLYKTGDLGRYLPDGNIEFMGRVDFQVKINGLRIELGEIESVVSQIPGIKTSVATVVGDNISKKIISFVVLDNGKEYGKDNEINFDSLESQNIITDPLERVEFKQQKLGIRKSTGLPFVQLIKSDVDEEYKQQYIDRRSYRKFIKEPISMEQFSGLFRSLLYYNFDNLPFPKYRYASAGGLYPVQAYLYVKKNRVEGVGGGAYYFKPDENKLILMEAGTEIESSVFPPGNKEIFDESAFTILLVGNLKAIKPMYGPLTDNFCYLEAGIMCQLLETSGIENQIGFCQIGNLEFDKLRDLFQLDEGYKYLHCMIGGGTDIYKDKYLALEEDWSGYKITGASSEGKEDPIELIKTKLSEKLPAYMIPSKIILLEKLPVTPNGKVDRKALSEFSDYNGDNEDEYLEPKTEIEVALAELIANYVNVDKVGMNHNLFQLGADSLVAIQLSSQIRKLFQVEISLRELFTSQTVGNIAAKIAENGGKVVDATEQEGNMEEELPVMVRDLENRYEPFPLTDVQEAYWVGRNSFIELGNISTHVYLEIEQRNLDITIFEKAWQKMIDRHEMLRAIIRNDGQQQILKEVPYYQIELIDLKEAQKQTKEEELGKIRERMSHQVLKADEWPLFEIQASLLGEDIIRLHVSIDLLISDVWSARIVTRELMDLYTNDAQLPPLNLSFRDYVIAEKSLENTPAYEKSWAYWQERIKTLAPAPELPLAKNPASLTSPCFQRRVTSIEQIYWDKLKIKANKLGVTHSGLLAAAYAEVLSMWSRSPRFTLNLTLFNRLPFDQQVNDIVGDFTSLILLEVNNDIGDSFENRVIRVQQQILEDIDHRYVSGVKVIRELSKLHKEGLHATMPVVFTSTLNLGASEYPSGSLDSGEDVYGISQTPQIWLDHVVSEQNGNLVMNWDAIEELFPEGMLDDMFESYCNLLYRLAEDEKAWLLPLNELVPLPERQLESREIIHHENVLDSNETLNQLFNKSATLNPDNIAIIGTEKVITYHTLSLLSNRVSNWIQKYNESPLVAIFMEKGWEQVVATLGVLQSSYAYLPISPDLPKERISYLLANSNASLVLTQSWLKIKLPEGLRRFDIDRIEQSFDLPDTYTETEQKSSDLAYVIYTSGSTGQPKGVAIDHKGAVNTIRDINKRFQVSETDRILALSQLNFDLSVYDIFGTLAAGGTIVIPDPKDKKNPERWMKLMIEEEITIWNSVPALMEMLLEYANGSSLKFPESLRLALLSGDWIPVELPRQLKAFNHKVETISLGGATEASIWSVFYKIEEVGEDWKSIPYGKAMDNQSIYVLDSNFGMRPNWVPGQIYIGGTGVAICYWKEKELTKEKFIIHPKTGERLYCTGDFGRYLPDGNIEFLGREDNQVKIMGHRIELGEIENAMNSHPLIKNSVVSVKDDANNSKTLMGYYILDKEALMIQKVRLDPLVCNVNNKPIMDPVERLLFKVNNNGIRKDLDHKKHIMLSMSEDTKEQRKLNISRRSYRRFQKSRIPQRQINGLLHTLEELSPIKVYLYLKEERMEGMEVGLYYYDVSKEELIQVSNQFQLNPTFYPPGNREIFGESAFSIFLVGKMNAFKPKDGKSTREVCLLEAGRIAQLLELEAPNYEIGLCQIGSLDYEPIKEWFDVGQEDVFIHNLVGGKIKELDSSLDCLIEESTEVMKLVELLKTTSNNVISKPIKYEAISQRVRNNITDDQMLSVEELGDFLSCLILEEIDQVPFPKARYSSAGTLHPVQIYIMVKEGRIKDLESGIYYYNPMEHSLVEIAKGVDVEEGVFNTANKDIYESSSFVVFMVAQSKAIIPLYPKDAYEFCRLEAGEMSQLLEKASVNLNIGLCPIGGFSFGKISHLLDLDDGHSYLHGLFGGKNQVLIEVKSNGEELDYEEDCDTLLMDLQQHLQQRLPKYMIPNTLIEMEEFPLTSNGKIDRKNLSQADSLHLENSTISYEFIPPNTELEKELAQIWCYIIGTTSIGIHDNFFDLGGNSMHLVKAYNKIKEEIWEELAITELFEHPTIYSLSEHLKNNSKNITTDEETPGESRVLKRDQRRKRNYI